MFGRLTSWLSTAAAAGIAFMLAAPTVHAADVDIRIGWQPTTTVEAQIAHTLAKTDILANNGLKGKKIGRAHV